MNVTKVVNILDGLIDNGVKVNEKLLGTYRKWDKENPFDLGEGWGGEPWSQKEMPLDEGLVKETAKSCETAIVIIGRTAGEEQDNRLEAGSYLLSDDEIAMLTVVREHFKKVVLLLNVGNIIDMTDINRIAPDAVLYVWQGGMTGGKGTAQAESFLTLSHTRRRTTLRTLISAGRKTGIFTLRIFMWDIAILRLLLKKRCFIRSDLVFHTLSLR